MPAESATHAQSAKFDPDLQRQQLLALLSDYFTWVQTERVRQVVGHEMLVQLRQQEQQIEARLERDFLLVVMGDFKRGKSTLINALLNSAIATTDVAPETVTINEIRYGAVLRAEACMKSGGRIAIEMDELGAERLVPLLAGRVGSHTPPVLSNPATPDIVRLKSTLRSWLLDHFSQEELTTLLIDLGVNPGTIGGETVTLETRARDLIEREMRFGRIRKLVELCSQKRPGLMSQEIIAGLQPLSIVMLGGAPAPVSRRLPGLERIQQKVDRLMIEAPIDWLRGIALVDTPGTNDLLMRFDEQVRGYVQKADALIYVTSALSPLSESEQIFLRTTIPARDFPKILFVVNRLDEMRNERNAQRLMDGVRARISQIFPDAPVFGLSALQEFSRGQGESPPQPSLAVMLDGTFDRFRASLQESILLNRDVIHLDRSISAAEQMVAEFEMNIQQLRRAFDGSHREPAPAEAKVASRNDALRTQIEALADVASGWMSEFLDRVGLETAATLARAESSDIQQYFFFYLVDLLRTALNRCLDAQRPVILELFNRAKSEIQGGVAPEAPTLPDTPTLGATMPADGTWASIDTFDTLVSLSLGSVFTASNELLTPITDLFAQGPMTQDRLAHIKEKLPTILPIVKEAMSAELHALYREIARSLEQQIEGVHRHSLQTAQTAVRQAHALHSKEGMSLADVESTLEMIIATCVETRQRLQSLRDRLWLSEVEGAF